MFTIPEELGVTDLEKAWLAGFIDGEGCIGMQCLKAHGKKYYLVRIQITQTDLNVLRHVAGITGVNRLCQAKRYGPNQADAWRWDADMTDAERVLKDILPYLVRKREVALLAIEYIEFWKKNRPPKKPRGKNQEPIDYSKFEEYKARFHKLNSRGKEGP
jgi:hypothetical protein